MTLQSRTLANSFRILLAAVLCLALAGCGAGFAYNRLDWIIPWYVDSYVDLSREQREALRDHLDPMLKWHRSEELARYEQLLQDIEGDLAQPVGATDVLRWFRELLAAAERAEEAMLKVSLEFGDTLSEAQVAEFTQGLRERQAEYEEEFLSRSDEAYAQESYEGLERLLERFLGRLEVPQKTRLRQAAGALQRFDAAWLEERALWLARLEPLLLERRAGWQQEVYQAFRERREHRTPRYNETLAHNLSVTGPAVAEVINLRSERQSRHLARKFAELREDLQDLRDQAPSAQPAGGRP